MKSLKVKKIVLKDPRLRKMRSNLRTILKLAVKTKREQLDEYSRRGYSYKYSDLSNALFTAYRTSISECNTACDCESLKDRVEKGFMKPWETSVDLVMAWIPWEERWCCVKCYEKYYKNMTFNDFKKALEHLTRYPTIFNPKTLTLRCLSMDDDYIKSKIKKYADSFKDMP